MVTRPELMEQAEPVLLDAEPAPTEEPHDTGIQSLRAQPLDLGQKRRMYGRASSRREPVIPLTPEADEKSTSILMALLGKRVMGVPADVEADTTRVFKLALNSAHWGSVKDVTGDTPGAVVATTVEPEGKAFASTRMNAL